MPSEDTTSTVNQSHNEHADQPTRPKNKKILLMLPEELQKKMKGALKEIVIEKKCNFRFETTDVILRQPIFHPRSHHSFPGTLTGIHCIFS